MDNLGFDEKPKPPTNSEKEKEMVGKLIADFWYLFGLRGVWNTHWMEIAQRIYPMHSYLFTNYAQLTVQGDKRNTMVYDSTGILALARFGAILDSLLTPTNDFWHEIRPEDPVLLRDKATRIWFSQVNQILFRERYAPLANFTSQNQNVYLSLGAYGTGALWIDDLAGQKGLRYKNVHLSEIYLQENHQGIIDKICRYFIMTARQLVQKFGDSCPEIVKSVVKTSPERQFFVLHWVMPREDRDPLRRDFKGMPYASYYIHMEGQCLLAEGGYRSFPMPTGRFYQAPNEPYGRSPAMDVLPSIKTLNEQKKAMLKQGERALDPVLLAHDDGLIDAFNMEAGSLNPGGVSADGRMLIQPLPVGQLQAGKDLMEQEQALINDTFLVNLFQVLTETPEMTATEVLERIREKSILLAPTIGRQQSEYLGPIIEREIDILSRQGMLPPMPRMLRSAKGQYKVVYDSPISRTRKAEWAAGAMRTIEFLGQIAQQTQDPSKLFYINWDVAAPEIADIYGTPAPWINTKEDVQKQKLQLQQMQQQQMQIQAMPAIAGLLKAQQGQPGQQSPFQQQLQPNNMGG